MSDNVRNDIGKRRSTEREKQRTEDLLRILPRGRRSVLDIGARDGHFSKLLTNYFPEVTALDLEKPTVDFPGVKTLAGDVTRLDFPDRAYDCVFCVEVLEHIDALERACDEIKRITKHEIVIGVPYRQDIRMGRTTCRSCRKANPPWGHVNTFTERRLEKLFSGWRMVSKSFVGTNKVSTNPVAMFLMDLGKNPWGTYDQYEACRYCGAELAPPAKRTLPQWTCSKLAACMNIIQGAFARPHGNWIHVVFAKD
jgi:SAM-dependent methyltransferase